MRKIHPTLGCLMTDLDPVQERAHFRKNKIPGGIEERTFPGREPQEQSHRDDRKLHCLGIRERLS